MPDLVPESSAKFSTATERADRRWSRALRWGMLAALAVHLLVLLLSRTTKLLPPSPFSAAGPQAGDVRAAAGGGSGLTMVEVRERRAQPEEVEPEPIPVPAEVVVEPDPPRPTPAREAAPTPAATPTQRGTGAPGAGGESGERADAGPGTATGTGRGGGGTEEEGRSGVVPPTPRGMILPPSDRPRSARGQEITVWVFVSDRGRVISDSTRLEPPTSDARYNKRLMRSAAEWVFEPARRDGRPVGAWYPFQIIL